MEGLHACCLLLLSNPSAIERTAWSFVFSSFILLRPSYPAHSCIKLYPQLFPELLISTSKDLQSISACILLIIPLNILNRIQDFCPQPILVHFPCGSTKHPIAQSKSLEVSLLSVFSSWTSSPSTLSPLPYPEPIPSSSGHLPSPGPPSSNGLPSLTSILHSAHAHTVATAILNEWIILPFA